MEPETIIGNIRAKFGIEELNGMQRRLCSVESGQFILLSPTGSGKTIAYGIPLLKTLDSPQGRVQAVIIAPARELVLQIANVLRPIAAGYKTTAFYGGHRMQEEIKSIAGAMPDLIVATPGRLLDHLNRKTIDLSMVKALVLDEYDKALEQGFYDEMRRIVRHLGNLSLLILTSATNIDPLPDFLNPISPKIYDYRDAIANPMDRMQVFNVKSLEKDKLQTLLKLLQSLDNGKVILFVNHRQAAERIHDFLRHKGLPVGLYHGGLEQFERETAIELLDNGTTPILVSTDLASRGLDIGQVQAIIHYHLPADRECWIHRNGRTARREEFGKIIVITSAGETLPEYIECDQEFMPQGKSDNPICSNVATLYFNAGKKEKLSRGDVVGFLIQKGGLLSSQIGKISIRDHCILAAIPADKAKEVLKEVAAQKIKNRRVRISVLQDRLTSHSSR